MLGTWSATSVTSFLGGSVKSRSGMSIPTVLAQQRNITISGRRKPPCTERSGTSTLPTELPGEITIEPANSSHTSAKLTPSIAHRVS